MCRCTYTWLLYVVRQSHVLPASWMRLFWSHCMLHSLSQATQHTTWGKGYNTVLWITHLYKYTVHVMNTFVMCIQHFWVASFPGLPRFRSSVCVDNNTRNYCQHKLKTKKRGRPGNCWMKLTCTHNGLSMCGQSSNWGLVPRRYGDEASILTGPV